MEKQENISTNNAEVVSGKVVLTSGVWYTICMIVRKGLAFLAMPIFTRIMSQSDVGLFNTYASWISLFATLTTFDLPLAIIRSKHEFKGDEDCYSFSVLTLTSVIVSVVFAVCLLFKDLLFHNLLEMPDPYIYIMFFYLLLSPAFDVFATKQRAYYKYKTHTAATMTASVATLGVSLVLVLLMKDKLTGRFIGQYITMGVVGLVFYVVLAVQGKRIKLEYWKNSFLLCFPLLLHLIALYLLASSDKIMITKYVGAEYTALYSVANSCVSIASLLMQAMNRSWAPWMLDMLAAGQSERLRKAAKPYLLGYFALVVVCLLVAPELILILGGKPYADAARLIPPLFVGTLFYFVYQMYLQTEFYEKKTKVIGVATIFAAAINVGLNLVLLPRFGYIAAGYTTMIGYMFMFAFHYIYASKLGYKNVFDRKFTFLVLAAGMILLVLSLMLYRITWLRYSVIVAIAIAVVCVALKYKDKILAFLKKS